MRFSFALFLLIVSITWASSRRRRAFSFDDEFDFFRPTDRDRHGRRSTEPPRTLSGDRSNRSRRSANTANTPLNNTISTFLNTVDFFGGTIDRFLTFTNAFRPELMSPALFDGLVLGGVFLVSHLGNRVILDVICYLVTFFGDLIVFVVLLVAYLNIQWNHR